MAIKLLPATLDDTAMMLEAGLAAFANDELVNAEFSLKSSTPEQFEEFRQWRTELFRTRMTGLGKRYIKAVDESTNAFLGYVGLHAPHSDAPKDSDVPEPAHVNHELIREVRDRTKSVREKHVLDEDDIWYVQQMVVHPRYQGRGIARKLLLKGLEAADRDGKITYLDATPSGRKLYERCGFQVVEEIPLDGVAYTMCAMIRHPQKNCTQS